MTIRRLAAAVAFAAATGAACLANAQTTAPSELELLKAQLAVLQQRLEQLEAPQQAQTAKVDEVKVAQEVVNTELQDSIDRTSDNLARAVGEGAGSGWMGRWVWKGDLRVRNENIDQEATVTDRNRNRFRLRVGALARVNDTTRVEVQFASTEGSDARSSNQSFTDANSRKALDLDTAYVEWSPTDQWKVTAGKMRYPWVRTSSYFFDNDINPEGIAANWQQAANGFFGSAFVTELAERSTAADTMMFGAQVGWRETRSDGSRVLIAGAYYDHGAAQGYNPFQSASSASAGLGAYGNSTTTSTAICRRAVASGGACLANDYNVIELLGEYQFKVGEQPLLVYANVARNMAADYSIVTTSPSTTIPGGLDTAWAVGFNYGRANASIPGTWQIGYLYQIVEKDALFAQWIDSDFAGGSTDGGGSALRAAWQMSRNVRFNLTYMLNDTNRDVAAAVTVPTARNLFNRHYRRLQVDFNWTY
ncbi:MAG: putative porin [Gammaproteobacteria bacterium]|nr:putative porin [Gammaproteobacteria bacterium]